MYSKLNELKYVFLLGTMISVKQKNEVLKISDKRCDQHIVETETFTLFSGLSKSFIQSNPGFE